jgi:8-oxo-dGTP diphosphatase
MTDHALEPTIEPQPRAAEPRVSARVVVVDPDDRVLLIRHHAEGREFYVLPGGRVEPGETAAEAAAREVLEETGLRVDIGDLLWVREYLPDRHLGHPHHRTRMQQLQLYFSARVVTADATPATGPDSTQSAVVWRPLASLGDLVLLPLGLVKPLIALADNQAADGPMYLGDLT